MQFLLYGALFKYSFTKDRRMDAILKQIAFHTKQTLC